MWLFSDQFFLHQRLTWFLSLHLRGSPLSLLHWRLQWRYWWLRLLGLLNLLKLFTSMLFEHFVLLLYWFTDLKVRHDLRLLWLSLRTQQYLLWHILKIFLSWLLMCFALALVWLPTRWLLHICCLHIQIHTLVQLLMWVRSRRVLILRLHYKVLLVSLLLLL